jgi:putative ABC transport system permease protein
MKAPLKPTRLPASDIVRLGASGLRSRPLRALLSALGIAIGIAAMLSVVGISASSRAELDRLLARLGTNLLTVAPAETAVGEHTKLPTESVTMIGRIGPVESVAATGAIDAHVYRNDRMPAGRTSSIAVLAATDALPDTVGATVHVGAWLNRATASYPAVVLGSRAAQRLDVRGPGLRLWLGRDWFAVVGILEPVPLAPELDSAALVGWTAAKPYLDFDSHPTTIYTRTADSQVATVREVLGPTANPRAPNEVQVSRPSDALAAKQATENTLSGLLLGLGSVALLVGGIGVANTMVISVLERRNEIGLRRSLGATRGQIRTQFLAEALLLSIIGGAGGTVLGIAVTAGYATLRAWPAVLPAWATGGGIGATLVIGAIAGLYPAIRASRLSPTEALAVP